ncbi:MAG: hypothetical protein HKL90_04635 [Elusimicrobia bacterium]|nr:hypothetical protein [Elusimicrobiota bacterium]
MAGIGLRDNFPRGIRPPTARDGRPVDAVPLRDGHGRFIPPGVRHIGVLDDRNIAGRIGDVDRRWDRNDHGYGWYDWDGRRFCHHYDRWGYHWWGFYVGGVYFWTRYFNDDYWWYDPYWRRWCWLDNDRWWWQNQNGGIYIVEGGNYYQYQNDGGTVVVVPDQTPPVDPPPGPTAPAQAESFYSADGTRFVSLDPNTGAAYLYDATVTDASDPRAQGRFLASGVNSVQFNYADGQTQTLQQITLTFSDGTTTAVVDPNGKRGVWLKANIATLDNLEDSSVAAVTLSQQASSVQMVDQSGQNASGEQEQRLKQITVYQLDGTTAFFDRDGNQTWDRFQPSANREPAGQAQSLRRRAQSSQAFQALQNGVSW